MSPSVSRKRRRSTSSASSSSDGESSGPSPEVKFSVESRNDNDMLADAPYLHSLWKARCEAAGLDDPLAVSRGAIVVFCDLHRRLTDTFVSEMNTLNTASKRQVFTPETVQRVASTMLSRTGAQELHKSVGKSVGTAMEKFREAEARVSTKKK